MNGVVAAALVLAALGGCAEWVQGPREHAYTEDRFYIRHVPINGSRSEIEQRATARCSARDRTAVLVADEQWYPFDTRVAVYRCIAPGEEATLTSAVEPRR